MWRPITQLLSVAILCWASSLTSAATVANLHTASVPVNDNSDAEFQRGLIEAFSAVLVKISGNSQIARTSGGAKLVGRAKQYNTLFGYERGADGALLLRGDFDMAGVSAALRERGLPALGRERPQVLVWLAVSDGVRSELQAGPATQEIFDALGARFAARGMPLLRARPDPTITGLLHAEQDNEAMFSAIDVASTSYAVPAVIFLHLTQQPDAGWVGRWQAKVAEELTSGVVQDPLPVPLLGAAVDQALDSINRHYTADVSGAGSEMITLTIQGVNSADDYGRLLRYLQDLDGVQRLAVNAVEGTGVMLQVKALGGLPRLAQSISFGRTLVADPTAATTYHLAQ